MDNFQRVQKIISEELEIPAEQITMDTSLTKEFGVDSLSLVEMLMNFEAEYDVTIPDDSFDDLETVGDIVHALDQLL